MNLLIVVAESFAFLFLDYNFTIIDGKFFGSLSGYITIQNPDIEIRLSSERGDVSIQIRSVFERSDSKWFYITYVHSLIQNQPLRGMSHEEGILFLKNSIDIILEKFEKNSYIETITKLQQIRTDYINSIG